jgi:hypothetical protein
MEIERSDTYHPAKMRNISNRALITDQILGLRFLEVCVEDLVQAPHFGLVAFHAVLDFLGGVAREVVGLALHWSHAGVHEEELWLPLSFELYFSRNCK